MNITSISTGLQVDSEKAAMGAMRDRDQLFLKKKQRGVVAIEFALVFLLGLLPLLFVTFSGVLLFAVKQSLTLAADNGARAALRYQAASTNDSCLVAAQSMAWLLPKGSAACTSTGIGNSIVITPPYGCGAGSVQCVKVTTSYDFVDSPFTLGLSNLYPKDFKSLTSTAVVQLATTGT